MLNAGVVKGGSCELFRAVLGEFPAILGRILRLQNPFKYICKFRLNRNTVHFAPGGRAALLEKRRIIRYISAVIVLERRIADNCVIRKGASAGQENAQKGGTMGLTILEIRPGAQSNGYAVQPLPKRLCFAAQTPPLRYGAALDCTQFSANVLSPRTITNAFTPSMEEVCFENSQ